MLSLPAGQTELCLAVRADTVSLGADIPDTAFQPFPIFTERSEKTDTAARIQKFGAQAPEFHVLRASCCQIPGKGAEKHVYSGKGTYQRDDGAFQEQIEHIEDHIGPKQCAVQRIHSVSAAHKTDQSFFPIHDKSLHFVVLFFFIITPECDILMSF